MKNLFGREDKVKKRKVKMPMDFKDDLLEYESTNKMQFDAPKMKIQIKKVKTEGIKKKNNNENSLF
jgi:hypothetical protein